MPIIALITAVAGLLFALGRLQRAGLDLNAFNPFLWMRRRAWEQKRNTRPIFTLSQPIEIAAVMTVAMAREGGELLKADRDRLVDLLMQELKLSESQARELFNLADHLLREGPSIVDDLPKVLTPSRAEFSAAQIASVRDLMRRAPAQAGYFTPRQERLVSAFDSFHRGQQQNAQWVRS